MKKTFQILCLLALYLSFTTLHAQETKQPFTIAGTVVDDKGEPIPAVSVYIKENLPFRSYMAIRWFLAT
jgi:hypothetical protein